MRNLTLVALAIAACLSAQPSSSSELRVSVAVTDPQHRFVTGLEQEDFVVLQNGIARPITNFISTDSPLALAVVTALPLALEAGLRRSEDSVFITASLSDAVRQLAVSPNPRKAIILTGAAEMQGVPANIQVRRAEPDGVFAAAIALRNQYSLRFQSADASAGPVEVVVKRPQGLPPLKPEWKTSF